MLSYRKAVEGRNGDLLKSQEACRKRSTEGVYIIISTLNSQTSHDSNISALEKTGALDE
jgi:hypothetical protein